MMRNARLSITLLPLLMLFGCVTARSAPEHPYYLHAISDLRLARAFLERGGNERVLDDESRAIEQIDMALRELKRAAIDDGKNIHDHPPIDAHISRTDHFHKALEALRRAQEDCSHEEDAAFARGLRNRALEHIDMARHATEHALDNAIR